MFTKFTEGLGGKLAEQWIAALLTPAFVFWFAGALAWAGAGTPRFGEQVLRLQTEIKGYTTPAQWALLIGALLIVAASAGVVQRLDLPILRLLEGYWPAWMGRFRRWRIERLSAKIDRSEERFQELSDKGIAGLSPQEQDEYVALDWRLMHTPASPDRRMPTALGNILRAAEMRSRDKYGLDSVICWPRLWLLLPEAVRQELSAARAELDAAARLWIWGALFPIWWIVLGAWWAVPVGILTALYAYRRLLAAAEIYGDLVDSAFDLHRGALYEALRWPLPASPAEERAIGESLTEYLWRGSDRPLPLFTKRECK